MARKRKTNSTVENSNKPESLETIFGVKGEAEQIKVAKAAIGELIQARQLREIFVCAVIRPSDGRMSLQYSDNATFDEVLAVLDQAHRKIVEQRYQRGLEIEAEKKAQESPPPQEPPHEH